MKYRIDRSADGGWVFEVAKRGHALLADGLLNKGTAFSGDERELFGLDGMLPDRVSDRVRQVSRAYEHIQIKGDHPLEKYIGMAALQDRNETLFYQVLAAHPEELIPIVYTPTVGEAAVRYSHIFRRGRGLWITPAHRGRIHEVLGHARNEDVKLIVVTDNERILGLGDQGVGGMVIPIGKLALYTMAAGIHPAHTLPISLDVGTDNAELLSDDIYVGWRQPRLRGAAYDDLVEEFVTAVQTCFPDAVLQWEDFKKANAFRLLDRYRARLPSFNDDIQGTAAVVVAVLINAARAAGTELADHRVLLVGAGAAGVGVARQLRAALSSAGLAEPDLTRAIAVVDTGGLVVEGRPGLEAHKHSVAWSTELAAGIPAGADLAEIVDAVRPTVLIGTSGQGGLFEEGLVRTMSAGLDRPIVMALSNPTSKCEAHPADLLAWTEGRGIVATGSPFDPVAIDGRVVPVTQCNNVYVFPGVGLGAIVSGVGRLDDSLFTVAAEALAAHVGDDALEQGRLLPSLSELRPVTRAVAAAVATEATRSEAASGPIEDLEKALDREMWDLEYPTLVPV